jgi:hypothetical protein
LGVFLARVVRNGEGSVVRSGNALGALWLGSFITHGDGMQRPSFGHVGSVERGAGRNARVAKNWGLPRRTSRPCPYRGCR